MSDAPPFSTTSARRDDFAATLDRAARHARNAQRATMTAAALAQPDAPPEGLGLMAEASATAARESGRALHLLMELGATLPRPGDPGDYLELSTLGTLDSPEARELIDLIEAMLPLAEAVDRQRGRVVPEGTELGPNETPGTDVAEGLQLLALRLRAEVYGAARSAGRER